MEIIITKNELFKEYDFPVISFPKYTSQLINLANQNAQGTRPRNVGQMTELLPEFRKNSETISIDEWKKWYQERYPDAIENATNKISNQLQNLKNAINLIDRDMIRLWVTDLIVNKTYMGLYYQQVILSKMASYENQSWRLASSNEEAKGIDGFIGERPYSIKPTSYKTMKSLQEKINATMIYYHVTEKGDLIIEIEE